MFGLINIYIESQNGNLTPRLFIANLSVVLAGFILTHIYRHFIIRYQWPSLSGNELLFRVLLANILPAFILCVWQFIVLMFLFPHSGKLGVSALFRPFVASYMIFLVWNAIYFSWVYVDRNRNAMIERLKMQNEMKDLEIKSIRSGLQPHFIFNSLNSIRALVNADPEKAREAITQLSNILRSSISTKDHVIPLFEEMHIVKDYLDLEKIRFEERLQFEIRDDGSCRETPVPVLLIQTLVENAVKHGISSFEEGGTVGIRIKEVSGKVLIRIKNPGHLRNENKPQGSGFGLLASKKRLEHIYDKQANILLKEEENHVIVEILIPKK